MCHPMLSQDVVSSIVVMGAEIKRLSCEKGRFHNCGMRLDLALG